MIRESYFTIFRTKDRDYVEFESEEFPTWDDEFVYIYTEYKNLVLVPLKHVDKIVLRKIHYPSHKYLSETLQYKFHINSN